MVTDLNLAMVVFNLIAMVVIFGGHLGMINRHRKLAKTLVSIAENKRR